MITLKLQAKPVVNFHSNILTRSSTRFLINDRLFWRSTGRRTGRRVFFRRAADRLRTSCENHHDIYQPFVHYRLKKLRKFIPDDIDVEVGVPAFDTGFSTPFAAPSLCLAECRLISSFFSV